VGPGLIQMLYCVSECEGQPHVSGWAPFSSLHLARRLPLDATGEVRDGGRALAARKITGWAPVEDLPHWEELNPPLPDALDRPYEDACRPLSGDKLGGWPYWVQSPEYPTCPSCAEPMALIFQVDSEVNLDHMWGDAGCAHLTFCLKHPSMLAFGWACS